MKFKNLKNYKDITKYLFIGFINTLAGFFIINIFFLIFENYLDNLIIILLSNFTSICFSFCAYKFYLFKNKENFFKEFLKFIYSNIFIFFLSSLLLYILIDYLDIVVIISSIIVLSVTVFFSALINFKYVFSHKRS